MTTYAVTKLRKTFRIALGRVSLHFTDDKTPSEKLNNFIQLVKDNLSL